MAIDRRAQAYAEQFHAVFLSRYIGAAKAGRFDIIPESIREPIKAYVEGRQSSSNVDATKWVKSALYEYRVKNGRDCPLPPEFQTTGQAVRQQAANATVKGIGAILREALKLAR
ncbi:hypothetical protein [Roseibium aestuarii]|uniref:Uncharacterized protein n=1 Tax=Roseibium aestuarii TaxID=2600299 RepID=A0ABW4JXB8_9HYPH|nr:hypothetical protein [Roseibium aestuarii]